MARLHIGCSGFSYKHWRGTFYPEDLPQHRWFAHYLGAFSTVELNVTFYRIPTAETFAHWHAESPSCFAFAIKGSRYITHLKRLVNVEEALDRFFGPALQLKDKLQVVLWQLPPDFRCQTERLEQFLDLLKNYRVRNTLELRNESWLTDDVVHICKSRNVALCMADHPGFLDRLPLTADFAYLRRHGAQGNYQGEYSKEQLERDAERIRGYLVQGRDVYIYYNNDLAGAAPRNAADLAALLG